MRIEGWECRLDSYLRESEGKSLAWGQNDCALWSARWVLLATGIDYLSAWEGKYKTQAGAARLMKKRGFADVAGIATAHLEETRPSFARRGDLVLHPLGHIGICNGLNSMFLAETGTTLVPTLACPRAWKVE